MRAAGVVSDVTNPARRGIDGMNMIHSTNIPKVLRFAALSLAVLGVSGRTFAQNTPSVEVSGGYQFIHPNGDDAATLDQGWFAEAAYNANRVVGLVGQVASNSESREVGFSNEGLIVNARGTARIDSFLAGVRVSDRRSSRAVWFGHALIGNVRMSARATVTGTDRGTPIEETRVTATMSDLGLQLGGGVTLEVAARIGLRVGLDSLRVFSDDDSSTAFRVTAGVVLPFGRR
jgi:outer membrane protein with beta-barrel domain